MSHLGRPSSPRTRPVPDAQAKACGFWLTHKLTNSSLLCKQSIAWPLIGRSYFDVQKHTNKVCRSRGMSPDAAAGVLVGKHWQNNRHSVLVNNIVIIDFKGVYNWLVMCASFKSWSSFILVLCTAFDFKVGFTI